MPILKSYVMPHGSNILDPENFPVYPDCRKLHKAALEVGKSLADDQIDIIFLITPHGHALSNSYCFYKNESGYGNVDDTKEYSSYTASLDIDVETTDNLLKFLQKQNSKTSFEGLVSYSSSMKIPLKWAEVIPLWFMNQNQQKKQPKFVILSLPCSRLTQSDIMTEEACQIGETIYEFLNNLPQKISFLISCDLAHTHKITGGPEAGTEPYGISIYAEPFDEAVEKWAKNPVETSGLASLLVDARNIVMKALSCGFLGLVILASGLRTHFLKGGNVKNEVIVNLHPTYFGMMIAKFDLL